MPTIKLTNVSKKFKGKFLAVKDVNLEIVQGDFLTIIGPSGCGKSTLLRLIAGLETPTSGEVLFDDIPVTQIKPEKRRISMVFQDYALYGNMTVRRNMTFGLKEQGLSKEEVEQRLHEVSEMLDITALLDRKPASLSGGQKQRVAIGRSIIRKPNILLFDEPFSNLDSVLCRHLQKELIELHNKIGATFIYVTHNKADAFSMGQRTAVMDNGTIIQIGGVSELRDHPLDMFIAASVSENKLNFMNMDIDAKKCIVSIPPKAFRLQKDTSCDQQLKVNVIHIDRLGATTELLCTLEDGQELRCVLTGDHDIPSGQTCYLYYSSTQVHYFDPVTKQCID